MISVEEARSRIVSALSPTRAETVSLAESDGRVLAEDLAARLTQPPLAVSAMDGYAVRAEDVSSCPASLTVVGHAPAGGGYDGRIGAGETVRIFTGGPVPDGADAIVIQENVEASDGAEVGAVVSILKGEKAGRYVRAAGLDFSVGDVLLRSGARMTARSVALAAAMNHPWIAVRQKPRVAVLATGDEIKMPGDRLGDGEIVSSNSHGIRAFLKARGCDPINLGIARDNEDSLRRLADGGARADLIVTSGGASVGDHDLVRRVLGEGGLSLDFWKIAMRPGKPLMFGRFGETPLLGTPGNPVSSLVCSLLFLGPAVDVLSGLPPRGPRTSLVELGEDLGENDQREDYLRARLERAEDGGLRAFPLSLQDSSNLAGLCGAGALIVRPPHAPPLARGARAPAILLDETAVNGF